MSYKIAIASSDGKQIDETFGAAERFLIYEVADGAYRRLEERSFREEGAGCNPSVGGTGCGSCGGSNSGSSAVGGSSAVRGSGGGRGCGGAGAASAKVELVSDCRCVVCKKIGFPIQKQLERKAISVFDVSCSVEEALEKISHYFGRIDNHESLRMQK